MKEMNKIIGLGVGFVVVVISAWLGMQFGWYLFFTPSSLQEAKQTMKSSECNSSWVGYQFKCKAAYDYVKKNTM